ncbi:MAG: cytochrome c oxidase subunit 3 [Actinobacteria bacterium]|nr:cytochrome c oxidase subunit 3 [Actinomycetota bacterium]
MSDVALGHDLHAESHHDYPGLSPDTSTGISHSKLGMWIFLASDCLLFGAFISAYLMYNGRAQRGPTPSDVINIPFTSTSTFVLLMSSLTMVLAVSAAHRGEERRTRLWLIATAILGASFIAGQVYEFTTMYREGLGYTTNIFGSSFFSLTGFHGVHVTVGIILLLILVSMSFRGRLPKAKAEVVEVIGLYWHFVDVVWIVIFTVVYLIHK